MPRVVCAIAITGHALEVASIAVAIAATNAFLHLPTFMISSLLSPACP
jgi:hypothetical protein